MKPCEINRVATSTWCPYSEYSNLMAVGSTQPSLENLSAGATLEIFSTDISTSSSTLLGSIQANDRFTKLSWGKSQKYSHGLLAGAMVDGNIGIWNPSKILNNE
jgi:protein transport protein SEC31